MSDSHNHPPPAPAPGPEPERPALGVRVWRGLIGKPRDLSDRAIFHHISLVPLLAWVGLGADGLSSSSYGPDEAYRTLIDPALGNHTYLAVALALAVALTIFIISSAYSHIIELFPHGGGGYLVATKLLGERVGVVSGCALLVDYVLTITVSLAAAGDALFSFLPLEWQAHFKLPVEIFLILFLTLLNLRGVKESVLALLPIFIVFLATHILLVLGSILMNANHAPAVAASIGHGFHQGYQTLGLGGMGLLFIHAYSMGGGTYTGLEAVSNGLPIMREPRVPTGKRTMLYMSISLAFMAAGLLVCYLLVGASPIQGQTLNAVLAQSFFKGWPLAKTLIVITLCSEGMLLIVGAQAGFIDGPRVLSNMAIDSWVPRRFAALSDRLTTQNGILLMGSASLAALLYTHGQTRNLVVMYSINVFLTFSLSMFGMLRHWFAQRKSEAIWKRRVALFLVGFLLCITILVIVTIEKFTEGGWLTVLVTSGCIVLCFLIHSHYRSVSKYLMGFDQSLRDLPLGDADALLRPLNPRRPAAAILVGGYGGTGIHMVLNILKAFPNYFENIVFMSVGIIDSGKFKGDAEIEALKSSTQRSLDQYVELARKLGLAAACRMAVGTDVVDDSEKLCREVAHEFPHTTFFAGQVVFQREAWYHKYLHNQTSFNIQKRLHWCGLTMVILPMRVQ